MISIAFFNNKGGVGKTTTLCNVAAYFQSILKKKTLVIDADPQCNASLYMIGEDKMAEYFDTGQSTIYDVVSRIERGLSPIKADELPILETDFGPDLIMGDTSFSMSEDFLSREWIDAVHGQERALKSTFVIRDLLYKLRERYDFVFIDLGPSLGAINRVVLLGCDFFIMPMSVDIFSLRAVENISQALGQWKSNIARGLEDCEQQYDRFVVDGDDFHFKLKFLGYTVQQYITRIKGGLKRPVNAYEKITERIPNTITTKLSQFIPDSIANSLNIGSIPMFGSLIPMSQNVHKPIFSLDGQDGIIGAHFRKVEEYGELMKDICNNMLNNLKKV